MKAGWKKVKLSEIALIGAGNSAPQEADDFSEHGPLFVRTSDVGEVRFGTVVSARDRLSTRGAKGMRLWKSGTILIPKSGASTFVNHRVILGTDAHVSSHLATIAADATKTEPRFLLYYLSTVRAQDLIQDQSYPSLKLPEIGRIEIPLPPLAEQKRIVAMLDEAFAGIDQVKLKALEGIDKSEGLLESQLDSIFSKNMEDWENVTLESLCELISGQHIDTKDYNTEGKGVGYLTGPSDFGLINPIVTKWSEHPKRMARRGDILITVKGSGVGKINLLAEDEVAISRQLMAVRTSTVNTDYLYAFLSTKFRYFQSLSTGAAIPGISRDDVLGLTCPMPPRGSLNEIVKLIHASVKETEHLASIYKSKIGALDEFKRSLLAQAFAGELTA
jgi:type I restriction enzyme S subunit